MRRSCTRGRADALSQREKLLAAMRRNPRGDWTIADVEALCRAYGVSCSPPTGGGSHYALKHPAVPGRLTIPARRPIKPAYVQLLVAMIDAVKSQ
jgi:hypothetical protein